MLEELVRRLEPELKEHSTHFEIILVNDGSQDSSWEVITQLAQEHAFIYGIDLMRNYGQGNALLAGIQSAKNEIIVTLDDDLQHPPEEIYKLLDKLAEGHDVVYGTPLKKQHTFLRNLGSRMIWMALKISMKVDAAKYAGPFRAFHASLFTPFKNYNSPFISIDVLLSKVTTRFSKVKVSHKQRLVGKSNYSFGKLILQAITTITGFSSLPLRLASIGGFVFMFFGFIILVYVIGRYITEGSSVPGFSFLASAIAIFSGVQLFALGIIGEYLAGIYFRTMDFPVFSIRRSTRMKSKSDKEN
jgi:undecaprenyl-phosphate 4-deoxy-4-formamido-L-arabinose transferase